MSISSDAAIAFVLENEGGFINNPNDPGGATNFGISLRFLREIPFANLRKYGIFKVGNDFDVESIKSLTVDQAKLIYKGEFWELAPFDQLGEQNLINYVFDMTVNHGISQASKLLQRAIWAVYRNYDEGFDDGIIGDLTIADVRGARSTSILTALMAERAGFMRLLAATNPKDKDFLHGWLKRCYRI